MRPDPRAWRREKEAFWKRVFEDLEIGYFDRDLLPLVVLVNSDAELYTTSSCSGRIVVVDSEAPWTREETGTVYKSHVPVDPGELRFMYRLDPHRGYWIVVTGPIIHLSALNTKRALEVLKIARHTGFKHSGILHISKSKGVFVELVTGVYVAQLVRTKSRVLIPEHELEFLVEIVNSVLIEGKKRLQRLYFELQKELPRVKDDYVETLLERFSDTIKKKTPFEVFLELCKEKGITCQAS
ncbi:MAG: tRNA(Phe) 7-((3-amino-3-carboxypropyl)-4-demethylwyosine(37)-N(4))-methyltransferase [Desulfurococcaceae archaeon]|jgi:tRNA wybutosine-synthesizing protein 3